MQESGLDREIRLMMESVAERRKQAERFRREGAELIAAANAAMRDSLGIQRAILALEMRKVARPDASIHERIDDLVYDPEDDIVTPDDVPLSDFAPRATVGDLRGWILTIVKAEVAAMKGGA